MYVILKSGIVESNNGSHVKCEAEVLAIRGLFDDAKAFMNKAVMDFALTDVSYSIINKSPKEVFIHDDTFGDSRHVFDIVEVTDYS